MEGRQFHFYVLKIELNFTALGFFDIFLNYYFKRDKNKVILRSLHDRESTAQMVYSETDPLQMEMNSIPWEQIINTTLLE